MRARSERSATASAAVASGSEATAPAFPSGWAELVEEIRGCTRCQLHRTREHVVVYRGGMQPRVLFVGEAPGAEEDRQGIPFVGRSGQRLDRAIAYVGLGSTQFGILNLIKCRPPSNVFDREAARTCRPFLTRQVALLDPEWIVPMGAHALGTLLPGSPKITDAAGTVVESGGRRFFPMLHPAAALHRPSLGVRWDRDLDSLRAVLSAPAGTSSARRYR
ncbi:MAG: uracil-DNA glycosylase [Thermoplasmata archaeon]|nr:uracil-DNA glycosylase [Thermoplasmata archaeon]